MHKTLERICVLILISTCIHGCSLGPDNTQRDGYNYEARMKKIICVNANPLVVQNMTCSIKLHGLNEQSLNAYISLQNGIELTVIKAQLTAYLKSATSEYDELFVSTKEDLCTYLNGDNSKTKFFRVVQKEFAAHGNMDHSCPYSGDLFIKNWNMESCVFESYIPHGNWRLDVQYFTILHRIEVPILKMMFYIDVRSDIRRSELADR